MSQPIGDNTWLNTATHARLRAALRYAVGEPAMSKLTPEEAGHLFLVMLIEWERCDPVAGERTPPDER